MKPNFIEAIQQLERGKRMSRETIREIVESALLSAARKTLGVTPERVEVLYSDATGDMKVTVKRLVVAGKPATPDEISLVEAKRTRADAAAGEEVTIQIPLDDLGRIAAQTAKHIVLQRVREVERESQYGEFKDKIGKAVTSVVKQRRGKLVILDLGDVESVLPGSEQIPKEDYRPGEHLKVYVADVTMTPRGPHIIASRSRPELVRFLFEAEVPEVAQGVVEIKAVAREPGSRSKVAVMSHDRNVDPVGACIGMKGMRVQAVVQELHGEKMDVVMWAEDPETFLINALSPAKPTRVVKDDAARSMIAVATDHNQLTHLIGRGGQNARLASKLTGWKVEIMTEAELRGGPAATEGVPAAGEAVVATEPAADATTVPAEAAAPAEASATEPVAEAPATPDAPAVPSTTDGETPDKDGA
jgi:N utilization substance protein A